MIKVFNAGFIMDLAKYLAISTQDCICVIILFKKNIEWYTNSQFFCLIEQNWEIISGLS